ncbi:Cdc6/Cdc18 family protein [Natronobacterium gregoryi]|uniref:AAA family ATPase n=2 Tax=Natronobacterium gregoryi TaxID=44930 RepID=L0AMD5_NATGS|nr:AAA family ATPase [Natronobacterium gregoryi]AFZ74594.1 Cdc6-related protein, AAA superfamily ATPase [Natronobacterium gregoryi SP2]ELY72582.1 ATPase AAA [Natronobacterium gregoryi SP2]PLK19784.1 AAA family ATPase [Natronobacterium gregoryi SP2]SFJ30121.1 ORC complex protein Cdc6/Orc1 [Natronobacterium gregoryi]
MIQDRWVFDDEYHADIVHRDSELESLSRLLEPATRGQRAEDALIYGPSGVGKTATTRWLLRDLHHRAYIQSVAIECSNQTSHSIIHEVVAKHPNSGIVHKNQSRDDLLETFDEVVDAPCIVILDEADIIPDLDVLDDLLSIELASVIAITHQQVEWLARLDDDVEPHFPANNQIEFRKYNEAELVDILDPRVERGLVGNPIQDNQLEWIADDCDGEARWAIKTVLAAAELAVDRGHDYFHDRDVQDGFERAKHKIRKANLQSLPVTYLRLYELVRAIGPVSGEEMKAAYEAHKKEIFDGRGRGPVSWRRAWDYLSKMADYDLLEMPGETNSKVYQVVDKELEAPVEFDPAASVTKEKDLQH